MAGGTLLRRGGDEQDLMCRRRVEEFANSHIKEGELAKQNGKCKPERTVGELERLE